MKKLLLLLSICLTPWLHAQNGDKPGEVQGGLPADMVVPPAPVLPPEEALKAFKLPPGYKIELVASEPLVGDPVAMVFDPDGRIWVAELRGYMRDPHATGETEPSGRIVVLSDTNGDGRMDKSTVFLDGLVMPRALSLVRDGLLVAEPPKLWFCRDTNGDGKCDEKIEVANDYATQNDPKLGEKSNPEHASNGLLWAMDNWIYSANHTTRFRNTTGKWEREDTVFRGQWGITQDDYGRLFYNSNSDQLRGDLAPSQYIKRNPNFPNAAGLNVQMARSQDVWPIRINPGINRGYQQGMLREGKLRQFTAAGGPVIYRGDALPSDVYGDSFVTEPSANFVRRNKMTEVNGLITADNAYDKTEFLTSTDERFRPVNLYTGPDGALYVLDLYRGIIQHRIYMTTFLRKQVEERKLDTPIGLGRIYRVVHESKKPGKAPSLSKASSGQLVDHLSHVNGWWRDTAQRLLVERADAKSVPTLRKLAMNGRNHLGRLHALWTLDGIGQLDTATLADALRDEHGKVQAAAIRLSEGKLSTEAKLKAQVLDLSDSSNIDVQLQLALTLSGIQDGAAEAALSEVLLKGMSSQYIRDAALSGLGGRELSFLERLAKDAAWKNANIGRNQLFANLARATFVEQKPERINRLLELAATGDAQANWQAVAMLDGILSTVPPTPKDKPAPKLKLVKLENEPTALAGLLKLEQKDINERAARVNELLTWPGKPGAVEEVAVRPLTAEEQAQFEAGKTLYVASCGACHQPHGNGQEGLAPPLVESEWVTGSQERLVRIVLHGVRGPIVVKGQTYSLDMPGLAVFEDEQIASIITYVRREWGHTASPVTAATVKKIRDATSEREEGWSEAELLKIP